MIYRVQNVPIGLHVLAPFCALRREGHKGKQGDTNKIKGMMVPTEWIEHSTSPLPRECSTTELRGPLHGRSSNQDG